MTDRLETRADFEQVPAGGPAALGRDVAGDKLIVSVGVDSSSEPKGASRVLAACREALAGTDAIVREVSGNGAMWMEPTVEIKRPGEPPVVYGWIAAGRRAGPARRRTPGAGSWRARAAKHSATSRHSTSIPSSSISVRIVMEDFGVIEPDSIEDAIARGAYSASEQGAVRDDARGGRSPR